MRRDARSARIVHDRQSKGELAMKGSRFLIGASVLLAASCSTVTVERDWDHTVDFSRYRTFAIREGSRARSPFVQQRIESAVTSALEAKGLKPSDDSPDLLVYTHVRVSREREIDYTTFGYGGWYGWPGWGPGHWGVATATVREIPVGTMIVDLVDARRKHLVWRGKASKTIEDEEDRSQEAVSRAVAKLFKDFPPTHVALARRAAARSVRAPAVRASSLASLGRLLAPRT
jgi:Domain of unknown function (DUF4136)